MRHFRTLAIFAIVVLAVTTLVADEDTPTGWKQGYTILKKRIDALELRVSMQGDLGALLLASGRTTLDLALLSRAATARCVACKGSGVLRRDGVLRGKIPKCVFCAGHGRTRDGSVTCWGAKEVVQHGVVVDLRHPNVSMLIVGRIRSAGADLVELEGAKNAVVRCPVHQIGADNFADRLHAGDRVAVLAFGGGGSVDASGTVTLAMCWVVVPAPGR